MNPLVMQLISALIAQGPQMIGAIAVLIKAAHGQPLDTAEHQALGSALAKAVAAKTA